ncbi:hypothetical protein FSS13T_01380 [Flavobacterium saliperosum S13]|uniref:Uncharacterized protein n=2 Tax=Flavobacterium saliperosum TaxID=329186 RepID=A0A1G4V2V0_9FLAO|nr:hypothetical protein [Flavobacterium saliperosum]ESU27665.1 hypothetical protein FSS13T_01380 [Flavobacterium saliperosum S13]SCX00348.1 hypothetical protein SAMN02927925_00145 [Flavobacterium saliperosum]
MKRIKIIEKNTNEFKNIINEIIKQKGHMPNLNARCRGRELTNGIAWNFDCNKEIKGSLGKNDGTICRYLNQNEKDVKNIMYSDYVGFKRSCLIDDILS